MAGSWAARAPAFVIRAGNAARLLSRLHAVAYRASGGRAMPRWFGAPVLVLETVRRRTGRPRATPLIHVRDGDDLIVMAANAGSARPPAWSLNLLAAGEAEVVLGRRRRRVRPEVVDWPERERLWQRLHAAYPAIASYEQYAGRELPVIRLSPAAPASPPPDRARPASPA